MNETNNIPVNKLAAVVVSKYRGLNTDFSRDTAVSSMSPIAISKFQGDSIHDLTGQRSGRYIIIGCSSYRGSGKTAKARWVGKCSCGRYQLLTTKSVKRNHKDTMCKECKKHISLTVDRQ
jgi:hypothetical protein